MSRFSLPVARIATAARIGIIAGAVIAVVGVAGHYIEWPVITAALGPTVYVFATHPDSESTRVRNASIGHAVGAGAGLASLAAFGLWHAAPALSTAGHASWARVGAVIMAIVLTLFVLDAVGVHHAPAGATSLLVATGLGRPGAPLYGLLVGVALVILMGPVVSRWLPIRPPSTTPSSGADGP